MSYTRKTNLAIYETTDYDKFTKFGGNRRVKKNGELHNVIDRHDKLKYNPMIVTPDFAILDGQHRLEIAKKLEKPVYYVIDNEADPETVQLLNVANRNWSQRDHAEHFAERGYDVYQFLLDMIDNHKISISTFLIVFCRSFDRDRKDTYKRGDTELKYTKEQIKQALNRYDAIYERFVFYARKYAFTRGLQVILLQLILHPDYNHDHMMVAIEKNPETFMTCNKMSDHKSIREWVYERLYNCGLKTNRIGTG